MEKKTSATDIFKPIGKLFKKFHLTLFFVFVVICLSGAVLLINQALNESANDPNYIPSTSTSTIDEETLNRLGSLHSSSEPSSTPVLPEGRINPFGE